MPNILYSILFATERGIVGEMSCKSSNRVGYKKVYERKTIYFSIDEALLDFMERMKNNGMEGLYV